MLMCSLHIQNPSLSGLSRKIQLNCMWKINHGTEQFSVSPGLSSLQIPGCSSTSLILFLGTCHSCSPAARTILEHVPSPCNEGSPGTCPLLSQGQLQPQQCTDGYTSLGRDAALNHLIVACTVIAVNQTGMGRYREPTDRKESRGL